MTELQAHYLLIYVGIIAAAVLVAAIGLVIAGIAAAKLIRQLAEITGEAQARVYPLIYNLDQLTRSGQDIATRAEAMLADVQPKLARVTTNIAETSDVYRAKVAEVDSLITDTTTKARRQSDRVDGMVTNALTRTGEMGAHLHHAIMAPARQLSGMVNGAKAGIEMLIHQFAPKAKTPKPVAFEGDSVYTGYEDDYHA